MDKESVPEDGSIDAGLYLLSLLTPRGETRTRAEIAAACGCSQALIYLIERIAIEKLRRQVTKINDARGLLHDLNRSQETAKVVKASSDVRSRTLPMKMVGKSVTTVFA